MKNLYNIIFMAGAGLLLLGAVLQITRWDFAPFIYSGCGDVRLCTGDGKSV